MNRQSIPPAHHVSQSEDDVGAALDLLRDAVGDEEKRIRDEGAQAMQRGDYDTATSVIDFAKRLLAFQSRVAELGKEWSTLEDLRDRATPTVQQIVSKRFFGRRANGEVTPQTAYFRPILEALVELGGRGKSGAVLDRVGEKMKAILKPKDYESHESEGQPIRWRNTAQWARNVMVNKDGRMNKSTHGLWEISDAGRSWLRRKT